MNEEGTAVVITTEQDGERKAAAVTSYHNTPAGVLGNEICL